MGYRYIGTKNQIINEIFSIIAKYSLKNSHIADLMCGTATVSLFFKNNGYKVTASDIMTFSYHHARVALLFDSYPSFSNATDFINDYYYEKQNSLLEKNSYEKIINALNNVPEKKGFFWREYSFEGIPENGCEPRNYFSPTNAKKIDSIRYFIKELKEKQLITELEFSLLIHDFIMAVNDIANISGTYGHYLSRLIGRAKDDILLKPSYIYLSTNKIRHEVIQGYAENLASKICSDICYLDPPYMKRQYAANYHILETIARCDEPVLFGKSGLREWRDQYSNFCTKTKIIESFTKIFEEMNCSHFFVSYSEDGLLKKDNILDLLSKFGKIEVFIIKNKRFRSNKSSLSSTLNEYLFHLVKD